MYQAKEKGRSNYQFFEMGMNVRAVERQSIEGDLRFALERDEFVMHYQPKIDLKTGAITGVEALVRWQHPERGLVGPLQFISVAEDCGLMLPIGKWALRESCRQAKAWQDAGLPPIEMAVNVSSVEFRNDKFLEGISTILKETGLEPRYLELELTESVLMQHAEFSVPVLQKLKAMGVRLAIDDFGTGYSSLSYLEAVSDRHIKGRSVFYSRDQCRNRRGHDHQCGDQYGLSPEAPSDCGRSRDSRTVGLSAGARV